MATVFVLDQGAVFSGLGMEPGGGNKDDLGTNLFRSPFDRYLPRIFHRLIRGPTGRNRAEASATPRGHPQGIRVYALGPCGVSVGNFRDRIWGGQKQKNLGGPKVVRGRSGEFYIWVLREGGHVFYQLSCKIHHPYWVMAGGPMRFFCGRAQGEGQEGGGEGGEGKGGQFFLYLCGGERASLWTALGGGNWGPPHQGGPRRFMG